jgi:hypothetical protein
MAIRVRRRIISTSTWTGAVNTDWDDADNWSPAGVPGADSDVTIATGDAVASASIGTVNSITDSSDLDFESAGTNTVAAFLDNSGHLHVDANGGEGGTILNIGTTLTNSGNLVIGNATLSAPDEVTAASLDNTGRIYLIGSSADQALLDVGGSAGFGTAGVLSGYARLAGDSAIEFKSGEITSLAAGSHLGLVGNNAFIEDSTALGKNSVPPVPPEFSAKLNVVSDRRKFAASMLSPVPKPLIVAAKFCACSRMSASAPLSLMVCPAETLESKRRLAFERLKDPAPPTAPASSSVSEAIEIEPLLVVVPDTLRAAKFAPAPVRSTVPLLLKDFAVTESDAER